ncbi:diacylglycerol kinase family protein [Nonomuraea sp. ATR24]|uniref:diacylglycerol/lipid kinase family protein n=1 Tax=Nonomuraea sp. ATR24 TaxID=1676744 RepID=UPI0035C26066
MAPQLALLVNPAARGGRALRLLEPVARRLRAGGADLSVIVGDDAADALVRACAAVAERPDALVAFGGDGLVHLAVQAVAGTDVPLGIIPAGTGNDIAAALGLPVQDPVAAARTVLRMRPRPLDAATIRHTTAPPFPDPCTRAGAAGGPGNGGLGGRSGGVPGLGGPGGAGGVPGPDGPGGVGGAPVGGSGGDPDGPVGRPGRAGRSGAGGDGAGGGTGGRFGAGLSGVGGGGGEEVFAGVVCCGFDSRVNERANALSWPPGMARYLVATARELRSFEPIPFRVTIDGGEPVEREAMMVAVGNTSSYGAGMRICPDARPDDGLLDVVMVGAVGKGEFLRVFPRVYRGTHVAHPAVTVWRARSVTLEAAGVVAYADGERIGPAPVTCEVRPGALNVLV